MSVTKHENKDGKLISQSGVNTVNLSNKSSRCSCPSCDSAGCFAKRNKELCHCGECKDIKNCLSLPKKINQENKAGDSKDTATKKIIREVVTRETIESLKKVTETLYGFDNENFEMVTERLSKLSNKKIKPPCKTSEISNKTVGENKDGLKKTDTKECCKQIPIVKAASFDVNQPQKEDVNTVTKLSAQVMNVPYDEIHESVPSNEGSEHIPISKLNIFKRIKEIYEACSCKVCECISSKPINVPEETCKCKPCDCHDCASLRIKLDKSIRKVPPSGCPCIRCDRKDCKGIAKEASEPLSCDCKPCDCIECTDVPKPCNCEPCQCINCKSLKVRSTKTVKMAQVDDIIQNEICQCSPCECIECKQVYNRTNPTIMCTTSTEMTRFSHCRCKNCLVERCHFGETETCTCQRHTSMRKSFEKNYKDYDVRTVIVDANNPFNQHKQNVLKKQSTIALFASLENNYPYNSGNKNTCKCINCECIVCPDRDETLRRQRDTVLHTNVHLVRNSIQLSTSFRNACTCTTCECEVCTKRERDQSLPIHSKCRCDICDCLNCDNVSFPTSSTGTSRSAKPITRINKNINCTCDPCDCSNCRKLLSCTSQSSVKFYSDKKSVERKTARCLRKVMLISPSSSQYDKSQKINIKSSSSIILSPKKSMDGIFRQDIATCHTTPRNVYPSISQSLNTEQGNCSNSNISSHGLKRNVIFNLKNPLVESTSKSSRESLQDRHIVETYNNLHQMTLKSLRLSSETNNNLNEPKYKGFRIIHEKPFKISPTDSNESLPIYFTYHNEALYSNNISRNLSVNYKTPAPRPIDDVNKCMTTKTKSNGCVPSCSHVEQVNKDFCERSEQRNNQTVRDMKTTFVDDYLTECCKDSDKDKTYDNFFYKEHYVPHDLHNTDPFRNHFKSNDKKSERSSVDNNSDLAISYEKATKVLREAKAFSSKLVKMLDSFDKANREFKSKSEKFKKLHKSLLDINQGEVNKSYDIRIASKPYEMSYLNTSETIHEFEEPEENTSNENEAEKEYVRFTRKPMKINDLQYEQDNIGNDLKMKCLKGDTMNTDKLNERKGKHTGYFIKQESSKQNVENKYFKTSKDILLKRSKTSHRLVSKCTSLGTNYINQENSNRIANVTDEHTQSMSSVMRKLDSVFGHTTKEELAAKNDDEEKKSNDNSEREETRPWTLFRKNLYINTVPPAKQKMFGPLITEFDIKEALQAIKLQTAKYNLPKVSSRANEALTNLQSEVSSLLNMPILQCNEKAEVADAANNSEPNARNYFDLKNMSSAASSQTHDRTVITVDKQVYFNSDQIDQPSSHHLSLRKQSITSKLKIDIANEHAVHRMAHENNCDAFKVHFVGLRRISDHTVLVKWSAPKCLKDVKGYELLVDGRAAQRCDAARRAAVLTCLPPAARVLLSVRAVGPPARAAPAHTVLYRPRR